MNKLEIPKEIRGRELTEYLVDTMSELTDSIVQDPQKIERFITLWSGNLGLHNYSIGNCILAFFQYPQLSMLAGFKKWLSLGRNVRKGEKAIRILAPLTRKVKDKETEEEFHVLKGFKYVNVWDINQTEGANIDFGHQKMVKGQSKVSFQELKKIAPLPVEVRYVGTSNGNISAKRIVIAPKDNENSQICTLLHEIAHYKLGHLGSDLDKETKEVEAETISHILAAYLGMDNEKSKYYVGAWNGSEDKLRGRGKHLISVAESIIRSIQSLNL